MPDLTPKQQKFVNGKLAGLNGTAAYIAAGYSPRGAKVGAANLAKLPHVKAALSAGKRKVKSEGGDDGGFGLRDEYPTGLALLQHAYNNPKMPLGVRLDCAKQALPYESPKIGETGKKQNARDRAHELTKNKDGKRGRFTPGQAPKLKLVNSK